MDFKNERLMMSEEEARNRAKELFNENQVDLIIKYMFLEQQCKKQKEINQKAIEYIKERFYFNEETGEYALLHTFDKCNVKELLDILNEVSK